MGSQQSAESNVNNDSQQPTSMAKSKLLDNDQSDEKKTSASKPKLSGFQKVQSQCRPKRREYNKCYSELYGSFVSAKGATDNQDCDELFEEWRLCLMQGM